MRKKDRTGNGQRFIGVKSVENGKGWYLEVPVLTNNNRQGIQKLALVGEGR